MSVILISCEYMETLTILSPNPNLSSDDAHDPFTTRVDSEEGLKGFREAGERSSPASLRITPFPAMPQMNQQFLYTCGEVADGAQRQGQGDGVERHLGICDNCDSQVSLSLPLGGAPDHAKYLSSTLVAFRLVKAFRD